MIGDGGAFTSKISKGAIMFNSNAGAALILLLASVSGCGVMPMKEMVPDIGPATSLTAASLCTATLGVMDVEGMKSATTPMFVVPVVEKLNRLKSIALPDELKRDKVVNQLLNAIATSAYQSQKRFLELDLHSPATAAMVAADLNSVSLEALQDLDELDFKAFGTTVRQMLLSADTAFGTQGDQPFNASDEKTTFKTAFIAYFSAYYKGKYVDRFGDTLAKPVISRTIGNTEIAGAAQVLLELLMDYGFRTPVWVDASGNYYPGAAKKDTPPTVIAAGIVGPTNLLKAGEEHKCGITQLKAEAIEYLANAASARASAVGGLVGGSFGGLHFGLGVFGKLSIGDNQTLQVLVKTSLGKFFERAAEEVSYRVLYWIPYNPGTTLAELVQKYLDSKIKPKPKPKSSG